MRHLMLFLKNKLVNISLAFVFIWPMTVGNISPFLLQNNQLSDAEVKPYLQNGEKAIQMTSVFLNGKKYSFYLLSKDSSITKSDETVFFSRDINYWEKKQVSAVLVFDDSHHLVKDNNLLHELFLTQIGGYLGTPSGLNYKYVPIDDQMIMDMKSLSKDPLFTAAFVMQEAKSLFKLKTKSEKYAEVIRLVVATEDQLASDFVKDVSNSVKNGAESFESAINAVITVEKYANDKVIRNSAKTAEKYFEKWEKIKTPSGFEFKIDNNSVSFLNWLDLGELYFNLVFLQETSPTKMAVFTDLVRQSEAGEISLSADLINAITIVSNESNTTTQSYDLIIGFVKDHVAELASNLSEDAFRKLVTNYIWDKAGTQLTGHILAGAFSSVFLGFSLAEILYGMDSIYENITVAENAAEITAEFDESIDRLKSSYSITSNTYPHNSNTFRELIIVWNLSMAQSYDSYADAISGARLLKVIANLLNLKWDESAREFKKYASEGRTQTESELINPLIIEYAIDQILKRNANSVPQSSSSSTVLVFDTSGSMLDLDSSGMGKIDAAKRAGAQILNVISAENSAVSTPSQIGIAGYSTTASIISPLTTDIASLQSELGTLTPTDKTAMADGLKTGLDLFGDAQDKKILILLSDGLPNIGLNTAEYLELDTIKQQVIDLATEAGQNNICIYTVGFGDPNFGIDSIDEEFLRQVAESSGCGKYFSALNAIDLANVYIELRHTSTGDIAFKQSGEISQDQEIDLGEVTIPSNQELSLFTLNWPGSKLDFIIKDPSGKIVDSNYPGATISTSPTLVSIIMNNPQPGNWKMGILGEEVPEGITQYNAIVSTRAGSTVVQTSGKSNFAVPLLLLVIACGAVGIYVYSNSIKRGSRMGVVHSSGEAKLIGLLGDTRNQSYILFDKYLIGRGSSCNLRINDTNISRSHAQFRYANGVWFIQDTGSKGGTYVNGQRVEATRLNNGDEIKIGSNSFTFSIGGK
jgi:Mg-chelatase subunit ChlD